MRGRLRQARRQRPEDIERRLLALLGPVPVPVDELARLAETPAREVRTALLALKLAGQVEWHGGDLVSSLPRPGPAPMITKNDAGGEALAAGQGAATELKDK